MQTNSRSSSPARRIVWLVIGIGIIAALIGLLFPVFSPVGAGLRLPFTQTALDTGWLVIVGILWLVVGLVLLWWLPADAAVSSAVGESEIEQRFAALQARQETHRQQITKIEQLVQQGSVDLPGRIESQVTARLATLETRLAGLESRLNTLEAALETLQAASATGKEQSDVTQNAPLPETRLKELDSEVANLGTSIQDAHRHLEDFADVNDRLRDLEKQLDSLYVTLHDVQQRLDRGE